MVEMEPKLRECSRVMSVSSGMLSSDTDDRASGVLALALGLNGERGGSGGEAGGDAGGEGSDAVWTLAV